MIVDDLDIMWVELEMVHTDLVKGCKYVESVIADVEIVHQGP